MKFHVNCNYLVHKGGPPDFVKFAQVADELKYDYLRILDHVVGVVVDKHPHLPFTPYTHHSRFPEVFTLAAYLSAITSHIGFITGVVALPQRQTALVAKQAAEVDNLSAGRLILGIGVGYNEIEFEAMGGTFKERGMLVEEQISVLRALWSQEFVSFKGRWHQLDHVNVSPLPQRGVIPIWMGAGRTAKPVPSRKILRRIGRFADGFMPLFAINETTGKLEEDAVEAWQFVCSSAEEAGREPADIGLEISLYPFGKSQDQVLDEIAYLESLGVTNINLRFPEADLTAQIRHIEEFVKIREQVFVGQPT